MKTEAERQLAKLVSMPTISDDITANDMALDYIEHYLAERGMHCKRHRFDGYGSITASTRPNNDKTPAIMLAGHVDIVAASEEMFALKVKGDKLIGRGVYDMKGALAGYMQLVDDLKGKLHQYDFGIMVTADEEKGTRDNINGTRQLVRSGYRPQIAILPDSTAPGWEIETLAKGVMRFDLVAKGRTAHGSRPWEGESASFKLIHALHDLKTAFADHGPNTDVLNIGVIKGGQTYNQIPSLMIACVEIRLMHDDSYTRKLAVISKICKKYDINYEEHHFCAPIHTDLNNPLIQAFMDSTEAITGKRPQGFTSHGQSDAKHFAPFGIPSIISCPEGGGHHSEEEWISRKSFLQFVPILHDYVNKVAKAATPANSSKPEIIDTKPVLV